MTLFIFFSTATWTGIVATNDGESSIFCYTIISSDLSDCWLMLSMQHRYCYGSLISSTHSFCMCCLCIFEVAREEGFFQIDCIDRLLGSCCEESFDHTMFDCMDHRNEVIIGPFLVYDEWILLGITLECDLFAEVCHTVDMLHPKFVDTNER